MNDGRSRNRNYANWVHSLCLEIIALRNKPSLLPSQWRRLLLEAAKYWAYSCRLAAVDVRVAVPGGYVRVAVPGGYQNQFASIPNIVYLCFFGDITIIALLGSSWFPVPLHRFL